MVYTRCEVQTWSRVVSDCGLDKFLGGGPSLVSEGFRTLKFFTCKLIEILVFCEFKFGARVVSNCRRGGTSLVSEGFEVFYL